MDDTKGYAVFLFPQALEALSDAIKPYLVEGQGGVHVLCREIDTGGAFIEMSLEGLDADGKVVKLELMIPANMVRMIVSVRSDESFGFGPRIAALAMAGLPSAPIAKPVDAAAEALPGSAPAAEPPQAPVQS